MLLSFWLGWACLVLWLQTWHLAHPIDGSPRPHLDVATAAPNGPTAAPRTVLATPERVPDVVK
jgi:hypothetical protein